VSKKCVSLSSARGLSKCAVCGQGVYGVWCSMDCGGRFLSLSRLFFAFDVVSLLMCFVCLRAGHTLLPEFRGAGRRPREFCLLEGRTTLAGVHGRRQRPQSATLVKTPVTIISSMVLADSLARSTCSICHNAVAVRQTPRRNPSVSVSRGFIVSCCRVCSIRKRCWHRGVQARVRRRGEPSRLQTLR
jgi:hypothetical protein